MQKLGVLMLLLLAVVAGCGTPSPSAVSSLSSTPSASPLLSSPAPATTPTPSASTTAAASRTFKDQAAQAVTRAKQSQAAAVAALSKAGHHSGPVFSGIANVDYQMAFDAVSATDPNASEWRSLRDWLRKGAAYDARVAKDPKLPYRSQ